MTFNLYDNNYLFMFFPHLFSCSAEVCSVRIEPWIPSQVTDLFFSHLPPPCLKNVWDFFFQRKKIVDWSGLFLYHLDRICLSALHNVWHRLSTHDRISLELSFDSRQDMCGFVFPLFSSRTDFVSNISFFKHGERNQTYARLICQISRSLDYCLVNPGQPVMCHVTRSEVKFAKQSTPQQTQSNTSKGPLCPAECMMGRRAGGESRMWMITDFIYLDNFFPFSLCLSARRLLHSYS